jgi:hypothetical protein
LKIWIEIRSARFVAMSTAVCLLAMSAGVSSATGLQTATGDAAATKPAPASNTHPKATTKSSAPATTAKKSTAAKSTSLGSTRPATRTHTASTAKRSSRKKSARARGQQKIDSERARSIQEALIREHYLSGEATGTWNQASEEAMRRYQADHGWQSKTVPDSRALIKLGLGPSKDHLLNPESAMTTMPDAPAVNAAPAHTAPHATDPAPAKNPNQGDPSSSPQ